MSVIIIARSVQWLWIAWDRIGPGWIALEWNGSEWAGSVWMGFRRFGYPRPGAHSFSFRPRCLSEGSGSLGGAESIPDIVFVPESVDLFLRRGVYFEGGIPPVQVSRLLWNSGRTYSPLRFRNEGHLGVFIFHLKRACRAFNREKRLREGQ